MKSTTVNARRVVFACGVLACALVAGPAVAAQTEAWARISPSQFSPIPGAYQQNVSNTSAPPFAPQQSAAVSSGGIEVSSLANLATGTLRGGSNSLGLGNPTEFAAAISDSFNFDLSGVGAGDPTTLYLRIRFDGEIERAGFLELTTQIGGSFSRIQMTGASFNNFGFNSVVGSFNHQLDLTSPAPFTAHGTYVYDLPFQVFGPAPTNIAFSAGVYGRGDQNGNTRIDFGNSAHFSFLLPQGATYTSQSGIGLTQTAVPEPAAWALMIAGFAASGAILRRRRALAAQL